MIRVVTKCLIVLLPGILAFRRSGKSDDESLVQESSEGGCDYSSLDLPLRLDCEQEGDCGVEVVCKAFQGLSARCIYALSSKDEDTLQKGKQHAAICLARANTHAVATGTAKKVLSMVASEENDGSDGFFSDASEENAAMQNEYRRPQVAHWWAKLYTQVGSYGGPQSLEVCNHEGIAKGGRTPSGPWSCRSDIADIDSATFRYATYVTHHYLNYLKVHDKSASEALFKRCLDGLYIQHMHTRLLMPRSTPFGPNNNIYDPKKVFDCSSLDRAPSTCNGYGTFGAPDYFGNDLDGAFWSTAVGTCFVTDPVTKVENVCGIDADENLLIDVASTVLAYHYKHRREGLPRYRGDATADRIWTKAVDVCRRLDCRKTSKEVERLRDVQIAAVLHGL